MLEEGTPPHNTTVRLAYILHDDQIEQTGNPPRPPPMWTNRNLFDTSQIVAVPRLLGEVTSWRGENHLGFINATKDDDRFLYVWPFAMTTVDWPPVGPPIRDWEVASFREAWGHDAQDIGGNFPGIYLPIAEPPTQDETGSNPNGPPQKPGG